MPYAAGTWTAAASTWNPAVAGTAINVADWTTLLADISTGLSTCILKDGSQTATALVPFAQGLSAGAAAAFNVNSSGTITAVAGITVTNTGITVTSGNIALTNGNVSFGTSGKGIVGTTTNDAAAGGNVGEFVDSSVTAVTVVTAGTSNITSVSLTAGDWDVSGTMQSGSTGTNTYIRLGISQNSASFTGTTSGKDAIYGPCNTTATVGFVAIPKVRISLAGTTTIYLVGTAGSQQITTGVDGYLSARRIR